VSAAYWPTLGAQPRAFFYKPLDFGETRAKWADKALGEYVESRSTLVAIGPEWSHWLVAKLTRDPETRPGYAT
jgi:hypothetical protein